MLTVSTPAFADPPKLAVFDLELIDTSLPGEFYGPQATSMTRLMRISDQLRKELAESGRFQLLDIAPVSDAARQQSSGLRRLRSQLRGSSVRTWPITGMVQKVSNLIININIYLRDVKTGS